MCLKYTQFAVARMARKVAMMAMTNYYTIERLNGSRGNDGGGGGYGYSSFENIIDFIKSSLVAQAQAQYWIV